jgi:hypothetical protein
MVDEENHADFKLPMTRRAILWGPEILLAQAVEFFLEEDSVWDVKWVAFDSGIDRLFEELKQVNPELVILCSERADQDSTLALQLLNEQTHLKVVALDLESNQIQVYSKQNFVIQGVTDLLSIVNIGNLSDCTIGKEVR